VLAERLHISPDDAFEVLRGRPAQGNCQQKE
jgi:hypothetical protein